MDTEPEQVEETQAEPPETPEQETPETPETPEPKEGKEPEPEADGEKEESEEKEPPKAAETPEEKHRRAGGWHRKIEKLERENAQIRTQLMEQLQRQAPKAEEKPKDPATQVQDFIASAVAQQLEAEREKQRQSQAQADFQKRSAEVRAANPDFDEALDAVDVPVSPALGQALLTSEQGPAIMYWFAKNPAELARISALPPLDAAREVGRLETKVSSTSAPKTPPKPASRPPAPPTSVGGSKSSTRSLEDLPLSEYKRAYRSGRR